MIFFQGILFSQEIFSWTAPDGQLYMVSSQEKLNEIKKKYDVKIEEVDTQKIDNQKTNNDIANNKKKVVKDTKPVIEKNNIKNTKDAGINIYILIIILSSFAGAFLGFAYNNKRNKPDEKQKNENIEIIAVIDRKLL